MTPLIHSSGVPGASGAGRTRCKTVAFRCPMQLIVVLILALIAPSGSAYGQHRYRVLHAFGSGHDGAGVWDSVTVDQNKNVYGTTSGGGNYGYGTVWELKWVSAGQWVENILQSFRPLDPRGAEPNGGVLLDAHGNVYGTTSSGGLYGRLGTAFKLSLSRGKWRLEVLHKFGGPGDPTCCPWGNLLRDVAGNLYGTGDSAFELSPGPKGWRESILHDFTGENGDGSGPQAGPVRDASGNLYGTTRYGGVSKACADGCGTVWELSPPAPGPSTQGWTEHILHRFGYSRTDGVGPALGQLAMDSEGDLFGATDVGGQYGFGTIFKLHRASATADSNDAWQETILYDFGKSGAQGVYPGGGVILDQAGNLYGTTTAGGSSCGCGVVYELSPKADGSWKYILLHTFTGPDGILPDANLTLGPDGELYGTTVGGGPPGRAGGVVFRLTP